MTTEEFHRKLTAILSADVQGYSRLMGEDEDSTVRTLTAYRELMSSLIEKHRGRVVDSPGDNLLAEFGSVMDAVRCAVEIQEELRIRNTELPENRKMQFRIGINLGDIIEDGDHIYGDGINIAARVEGLAEGGGICISGTVYDAIRNKLSMSYEFMGEHVVKNIKELVRIYRIRVEPEAETVRLKERKARLRTWQWAAMSVVAILILGAVAIWYFSFRHAPVVNELEEGPKTIAVLPFVDLSPEKDQEYFVDGLTEELLNCLAQIPGLRVTSRTSSFSFKGSDKTSQEIANILGVGHIIEGSVRKAEDEFRITAQLIRAVDDFHIWSKTYGKDLKDIFTVQEEIATAIASELKATISDYRSIRPLGGTGNLEAYDKYLTAQGQWIIRRGYAESSSLLELVEEAIAIDPDFALAWALKSDIHHIRSIFIASDRTASEHDAALRAALKTIEIEPDLAAGYVRLGSVKTTMGDWIDVESAYRKASELITKPLSGNEVAIGIHYLDVGYFEKANEIFREIQQNDPLNEEVRTNYYRSFVLLGEMQRAEEEHKRTRTFFKGQWNIYHITQLYLRPDGIIFNGPLSNLVSNFFGLLPKAKT